MSNHQLIDSWQRTEKLLQLARSQLADEIVLIHASLITEFDDFLTHNELGLAYETLCEIGSRSELENISFYELLKLAAIQMELDDGNNN